MEITGISATNSVQGKMISLNQKPTTVQKSTVKPQTVAPLAGVPTTASTQSLTAGTRVSTGGKASAAPAAGTGGNAQLDATVAAVYTTSVKGTSYSGSVDESDGTYTASVPSLAGASAAGSSILSAESNLSARIDELV